MKKITLLFCFSIVGFVGIAQQSETSTELKSDNISITISNFENSSELDNALTINNFDATSLNLEHNSHELVHNQLNTVASKDNFIGDNYTYNDYVINFDFKQISLAVQKL